MSEESEQLALAASNVDAAIDALRDVRGVARIRRGLESARESLDKKAVARTVASRRQKRGETP